MSGPGSQRHPRDLPSLNVLRAVAAFAVFVNHCAFFFGQTAWSGAWSAIRPVGMWGLFLFFVLSGYLLGRPGTLRGGAGAYALRRLARIYPVYLLALVLSAASMVRWGMAADVSRPSTVLLNVLLVQSWSPHGEAASIALPAWSLSVELAFYAVLPLTLGWFTRCCRTRPVLTLVLLCAAAVLGGHALAAGWVWPTFPPAYLPVFYLGTYGAVRGLTGLRSLPAAVAVTAGSVVGYLIWPNPAVAGVGCLVLVLTVARHDRAGHLARGGAWRRAGAWTLPFFLLHLVVLDAVAIVHPDPARTVLSGLTLAAVVLGLSLLVAAVTHRYIEEPGRRWVTRTTPQPQSLVSR